MLIKSGEPAFFPAGSEVSAKFKGAYCEAKIKKVVTCLKVKVLVKEPPYNTLTVSGTDLPNAKFQLNEQTELVEQHRIKRCTILTINDHSKYQVVFNDGDEKELRRTQLVAKGEKHFESERSLEMTPNNSESFSAPFVRGAAKRGAQKLREMSEASGSRSRRNDVGVVAEVEENDDEAEDAARPREKRKAANAAVAAIGELNQAQGPDTQSDESGADSTEEKERTKERRKKREEDKAGPSSSTRASSVADQPESSSKSNEQPDRPSPSPTPNGTLTAKEEKNRLKLLKKEEKKRKKEEEKEAERQQKQLQKDERNVQRELEKERKKEQQQKEQAKKEKDALFKSAVKWVKEFHSDVLTEVLYRPRAVRNYSIRNFLEMRKPAKARKKVVLHSQARIRHHVLFGVWMRRSKALALSRIGKHKKQWWKVSDDEFAKTKRVHRLLRNQQRFELVERWLRRMEILRDMQLVVVHEDHTRARKLLNYLEKDWDKTTLAERFNITGEDINSSTLKSHFRDQLWYPAILLPGVSTDPDGSESQQRIIRHMTTGQRLQVWENDLIPFQWVPSFNVTDQKHIIGLRPQKRRYNFRVSWLFAEAFVEQRLDLLTMKFRLRKARQKRARINREETPVRVTTAPPPSDEEDDRLSDYDSDTDIKEAPEEQKNSFIMSFMYHNDAIGGNSNPTIQGYDVDVFYFHELILKMGGSKKFWNANQWTKVGKKLVPLAVDPEEDLKKIFKESMESFMQIRNKLNMAPNLTQPVAERKVIRPGQYSEARKRKNVDDEPGTSSKTSSDGAGKERKKRLHTDESPQGRSKKSRTRESTSRESRMTTVERDVFGPSTSSSHPLTGLLNSESDDDGDNTDDAASSLFSADGSERKTPVSSRGSYKKRGSTSNSRSRRSMSIRHEDGLVVGPPKKGRPRKNTLTPTSVPPMVTVRIDKKAEKGKWKDYMGANIFTTFVAGQKLGAFFGTKWWQAAAVEDSHDTTEELMRLMLKEQANYAPEDPLSRSVEQCLTNVMLRLTVFAHYIGWNNRYDEYMVTEKVLVTMDEQAESRRRFRDLPRGKDLYPETMAKFEFHFQHWKHPDTIDQPPNTMKKTFTLKEFFKMACEALSFEPLQRNTELTRDSQAEKDDDSDKESDVNEDFDDDQPRSSSTVVMRDSAASADESDSIEKRNNDVEEGDVEIKSDEKEYSPEIEEIERDLESESDEPVYPPGPSAEEILTMELPVLNTIPSLKSTTSAESGDSIPCLTPQNSTNSLGSPPATQPTIVPQTATNLLAYSGPLTLDAVQPALPPATATLTRQERHDNEKEIGEREEPEKGDTNSEEEPASKRMRRVSERDHLVDTSSILMMPPLLDSSPITSGALTLDIPLQTESSGPIEPPSSASSKKGSRKKMATPSFQKPSSSVVTSGPLTLSPVKVKSAETSPLGRPKKKLSSEPIGIPSVLPKPEHKDEEGEGEEEDDELLSTKDDLEEEIRNAQTDEPVTGESSSGKESSAGSRAVTSGSTTPMTVDEKDDDIADSELDKSTDAQLTPRGSAGSARGKKKKGGRFGGTYPVKPVKSAKKKEENGNGEEVEPEEPQHAPNNSSTPTHSSRTDSFQTQKNRMARIMELDGTRDNYDLLGLPNFEQLLASAPQADVNFLLEERTNELRELYAQAKADLSQLERRYRLQNDTKRKTPTVTSP